MKEELLQNLKNELKKAVSQHYKSLKNSSLEEYYYGYSLYTSDDVPDIQPVANRLSAIQVEQSHSEYDYYRYCPNEWSDWNDFGLFEQVNAILTELDEEMKNDFLNYKRLVLEKALEAFSELESEGLFGEKNDERFLIIFISDSDNDIMKISADALNTPKVHKKFISLLEL